LELLQQEISKKSNADCSSCTKPNQFCNLESWAGVCKACPICGIDHYCDGRGFCTRCPGIYDKPTMSCMRSTLTDIMSGGMYAENQPIKLAFSTVGEDLFYLSAEPNATIIADFTPPPPPPPVNGSSGNSTVVSGNGTVVAPVTTPVAPTPIAPQPIGAHLSTTPSTHIIEEIVVGSGNYRIRFNDAVGGYLRVVPVDSSSPILLSVDDKASGAKKTDVDIFTYGISAVCRDFTTYTTFNVEHSASYSWRFRVGSDDTARYLAWCGQSTCGQGVPRLRLLPSMYCGALTTDGIRCDVMITN